MEDRYVRIADLRYMEQQMAQLLRQVVAHAPSPPKEVTDELCGVFADHDRHYIELDAVLRDAGEHGHPVFDQFRREFDDRLESVGTAETAAQLVAKLDSLETFAAEEYTIAVQSVPAELRDLVKTQRDDERHHAQFLETWLRTGGRAT
jgi:hypothetical protein